MLPKFAVAVGRMVVQLLVLCLMVWALLRVNSPWLLIAWLVVMAVYAGWIVLKRCKLNIGKLLLQLPLHFLCADGFLNCPEQIIITPIMGIAAFLRLFGIAAPISELPVLHAVQVYL